VRRTAACERANLRAEREKEGAVVCVWCTRKPARGSVGRASPRDATDFTAKRTEVGRDRSATVGRSVDRTDGRTIPRGEGAPIIGRLARAAVSRSRTVCPLSRALSRRCARSLRISRVCACDLVHAPGPEVGCQRTRAAGYPRGAHSQDFGGSRARE